MARVACGLETYPDHNALFVHAYDEIMAEPLPQPAKISRKGTAGLGTLDTFPAEILLETLEFLDFQSLCRFRCVSIGADILVKSLPAYSEVITHAPGPLRVLAKTGLLRTHSCFSLQLALRSNRCAACSKHGGFLFLLGCERACSQCLARCLEFHAAAKPVIMFLFNLLQKQAAALPTQRTVPGRYSIWPQWMAEDTWDSHSWELLNIMQAKQLALKLNTSSSPPDFLVPESERGRGWDEWFRTTSVDIHNIFLDIIVSKMANLPLRPRTISRWLGMSHVRFP